MRIGIVLINKSITKGGADKRYLNLVSFLSKDHEIFLLTNYSEYVYYKKLGIEKFDIKIEILEYDTSMFGNSISAIKKISTRKKPFINKKLRKWYHLIKEVLFVIKMNFKVTKWIMKNDIKYLNTIQTSGIYGLFASIFTRKIVFTYTDYEVTNGYPFKWVTNMGLKSVFKFSSEYDLLSKMVCENIERKGLTLNPAKINIAPCSFSLYKINNEISKVKNMIVFAGRLEMIKNPILAIEASKILKQQGISFRLFILGKGPLESELNKIIKQYELDDMVILEYSIDIHDYLKDARIFLSLQINNNYPSQSVIEAMSSRCVVIATNVGETYKFINDKNGILINADPNELAQKIKYIFDNVEIAEKISKNAESYIKEQHTIERYSNYYLNLFNDKKSYQKI